MNEIILRKKYIKKELYNTENQMNSHNKIQNTNASKFKNDKRLNMNERISEKRYQNLTERNLTRQQQNPQAQNQTKKQPRAKADESELKKQTHQHSNRSMHFLNKMKFQHSRQKCLVKTNKKTISSFQGENKINNTLPLMKRNITSKLLNQNRRQQCKSHLDKSHSCKYRAKTYIINAQQLGQIFKNNQGKQTNKSVALRMKSGLNKRLYDQAVSHLFSITNKNIIAGKIQSQMPEELGIKEIQIFKQGEQGQKINKYKQILLKKNEKIIQGNIQSNPKRNLSKKIRKKADSKLDCNCKQGQLSKQFWFGRMDKPFEPWQFERISSNFFY